jgi:peptidoglycan/xylan/chitin deacetylase (PgdA/CDA1 family)
MNVLARKGYQAITLMELLDTWRRSLPLPRRTVVLTFDDGFGSVLEHAVPALAKHGFRATLFAVAGYLGKLNDWPSQPKEIPRMPLLDLEALRLLGENGFEIGAHGMTHTPLDGVPAETVSWEMIQSKKVLEELGKPVPTFAFPVGLTSPTSLKIVREQFQGACGTSMKTARSAHDIHLLPRIDSYYLRNRAVFQNFDRLLGRLYLAIRAGGRSIRLRVLQGKRNGQEQRVAKHDARGRSAGRVKTTRR